MAEEQVAQATTEEETDDLNSDDSLEAWLNEQATDEDTSEDLKATDDAEQEEPSDEGETSEEGDTEEPSEEEDSDSQAKTEEKEEPEAEELDFAKVFPHGLELETEDGVTIGITSTEDLVERLSLTSQLTPEEVKALNDPDSRKSWKDHVEWEKRLHNRGLNINKRELELQQQHAAMEKELAELRSYKAQAEAAKSAPPKPDESMIDPESDNYNPAKYMQMVTAYTEASILNKLTPKQQASANPMAEIDAAENRWIEEAKSTGLDEEAISTIRQAAYERVSAQIAAAQKAKKQFMLDEFSTQIILEAEMAKYLRDNEKVNEEKLKTKATSNGARTVIRALKRASNAPKPSKTERRSTGRASDPLFDEDVSPSEYMKKHGIKV